MITQAELKKHLHYNINTGIFIWCEGRPGVKRGSTAGCFDKAKGYHYIRLNRRLYLSHRLAWLYVHGYWPEPQVDHINRNRSDNRICNLREVTHQCNSRNCNISKNNTSGITGVSWDKRRNKWKAHITVSNILIDLGRFIELKEAVHTRWEAEKRYNFPTCNTTSSSYQYLMKNKILADVLGCSVEELLGSAND